MATFTLTKEVTETFDEGWGVDVVPIWDWDIDEKISEIHVSVAEIKADFAKLIGGQWCVSFDGKSLWVPIANFEHVDDLRSDDTHDLRSRWFETEAEARAHAGWVEKVWANPEPWRSFVMT
jgi:hypothetical protein